MGVRLVISGHSPHETFSLHPDPNHNPNPNPNPNPNTNLDPNSTVVIFLKIKLKGRKMNRLHMKCPVFLPLNLGLPCVERDLKMGGLARFILSTLSVVRYNRQFREQRIS